MRAAIIKIGNSKGIRIPKAILDQCGLKDTVDLTVRDHTLLIQPHEEVRKGWAEAFKRMAQNNDDVLLDEEILDHSWDKEEWEW